jgi:hypothetical protein
MKKTVTKKIIFLLIFSILALVTMNINFSSIVGAKNQYFTLFQFLGPIAGSFLGSILGILAVFCAQVVDILVTGKAFSLINMIRLAPMLFAVFYFSSFRKQKNSSKLFLILIPATAMMLFILHPVGRHAWFYSLYWLIPILSVILPKKVPGKLFFRSLGATFTAHAIGSIAFLYTVPMTSDQWISLIPIVAYERLLFTAGIMISFVAMNTLLNKVLDKLNVPSSAVFIEKEYVLFKAA